MASVVPGYQYDIFISYRQKDNKYDGWVTDFVNHLKLELEATFKEEVSVYFDINPSDGLLETHEVNASLKEKLKCLIFIPIISQTYCDPKSYAWQYEFCTFNKLAKEDHLGRSINLLGGNVASRILPVRIHDLDIEDQLLIEKELGGALRGIDFIYKSAGVNRPLRANEDHPRDNLSKTYYRDQLNKTANAVKEILQALKNPKTDISEITKERTDSGKKPSKKNKAIILSGSLLIVIILTGYMLISKLIISNNNVEKSIAVLPFVNDSPDQENAYFINGMMDEILNNLRKIKDFRVLSRTSTEQFKGDNKPTIPEIAKKLNVNYIVEGSGQKYGNTFRLRVQLIDARNEKHLWGDSFEKEISSTKDIFNIQSQVAQTIAARLQATITPDEKRLIEKSSTINLTAYDFYRRGQDEIENHPWPEFNAEALKRAEVLFHKALEYDSTFAQAYSGLAGILWIKSDVSRNNNNADMSLVKSYIDSMRVLADIALSYDDHLEEPYMVRAAYYIYYNNFKQTIEEYDKAIKYNPNAGWAYVWKGRQYENTDFLKSFEYFHKAASLDHGPGLSELLMTIGVRYYQAGFPEKGNDFFLESLNLDGDTIKYSDASIKLNLLHEQDYNKAIKYFEKRYLTDSTNIGIILDLGFINTYYGNYKESLKYFKKYLSKVKDDNPEDLANFIGYSYLRNGYTKEADYYFNRQIEAYNRSESTFPGAKINSAYSLAAIYACRGDKATAYEYLKIFTQNQDCTLIPLVRLKRDPMFNNIRNDPEFQKILKDVEAKYQVLHQRVRKWLAEQGHDMMSS